MKPIRVLVAEDSLTVRKRIVEVLAADPQFEVVAEAADGAVAVTLCRDLRPDVVTMDMMMPGMTGLAAIEQIMAYWPTPILVVSASINRGELFRTYDALAAGAVDVLDKPSGDEVDGAWEQQLRASLRMVARIRVITHPRARLASISTAQTLLPSPPAPQQDTRRGLGCRLIAIGVSTGGPSALQDILRKLPADFPLPVLVVIHIGRIFASAFAEWLDGRTLLPVSWARDGEPLPQPGASRVVVAPPDKHLVVRGGLLRLEDSPELHSCRPAVDALFFSLAQSLGGQCAAFLLTGMGRDGADGLLAIRQSGGFTVAQDEASSVVFGMPREAVLRGAAERVLPLDQIGPTMLTLAGIDKPRKPR